eukprot:4011262-Amphidinium_carterae.1
MAIPTSRKGPTRHQLTHLKKFVMENDLGQSIIQVDNAGHHTTCARSSAGTYNSVETIFFTHPSGTRFSRAIPSDIVRTSARNQALLGRQVQSADT